MDMMNRTLAAASAAALLLGLCACKEAKSPAAFYEEYYAKSAAGFASLDEDAAYHSKRKRAEVEAKLPAMMQSMGKTREEVVALYLDLAKATAHCKKIELAEQQVSDTTAQLTYRQTDVCGNASTTPPSAPQSQRVRLVNEGGWKIDHVEIAL